MTVEPAPWWQAEHHAITTRLDWFHQRQCSGGGWGRHYALEPEYVWQESESGALRFPAVAHRPYRAIHWRAMPEHTMFGPVIRLYGPQRRIEHYAAPAPLADLWSLMDLYGYAIHGVSWSSRSGLDRYVQRTWTWPLERLHHAQVRFWLGTARAIERLHPTPATGWGATRALVRSVEPVLLELGLLTTPLSPLPWLLEAP